ncbi:MAG TPA: flagellar filament capping protein FliD [Bryobacteraceae bacterium]|jgi:flagellar hook-associated protein 2|nr:flagellar filament capping protein FliD [Bryobacteraceae bacterium]
MSSSVTAPVTVSNPGFTGVSKFATSLQQVLTRAVGIASLPLQSLQTGLTTLNSQEAALQGLDTNFSSLQIALSSIQSAVTSGLLSTSVSNGGIASATAGAGASAASYTLEVDNLGAYSTALSVAGAAPVTDPTTQGISSSTVLTLSIGGTPTTITAASTSLQDLASAINSQAAGQAQATIVNVGSTSSPDYRLSVQAASLGTGAIDLTDPSGDLISSSTAGVPASYIVDGAPAISSTTRNITLAPGLTVSLLGQSAAGVATTITVKTDTSTLASAFSNFASAYNAAADAISAQRGKDAGALSGDSTLQSLSSTLSQLGTFTNGTPASALANFGVTLDQNGQLSVDTGAFTSAANANLSTLISTLGGADTGGFLQFATNALSGIEDSTTGILPAHEASVNGQITAQNTQIASEQATVNQLQTNLTAQISLADSTLAELESQVSYVTGLFGQYTGATNTQANGLATL